MLVREEGDQLHLLSVISPEWIGNGKTIVVTQAPTYFGTVAFTLEQPASGEAVLHLNTAFTRAPKQIVVHLPWFVETQGATIDGKGADAADGKLVVPPNAKEIRIQWTVKADTPGLSYQRTVDDYKAEYARRYRDFMHGTSEAAH